MPSIPKFLRTCALIGAGSLACMFASPKLLTNSDLEIPVNPLGIKRSPYGEVIAMALQGPIDTYIDSGVCAASHPHEHHDCSDCSEAHKHPAAPSSKSSEPTNPSLNARFNSLLLSLDEASEERTNPKAANDALKLHLRRQAEDKLRFAYQLDPAHYGNYNSLHLFLTEPAIGTRPELTPSAAKLAEETIQYCLKQDHDPRPALTAAAACTNILFLMFADQQNKAPKYNTRDMRQCLNLLDHCLTRYHQIAADWDQSKQWDLLSPQRIAECVERARFTTKIRDAAEITILRHEREARAPQASN